MINYIVFVFSLVIAVTSSEVDKPVTSKAGIKKALVACQNDPATKVDDTVLSKFKVGEFLDDPKAKAFILCVGKGTNFAYESGELNIDNIKSDWAEHYEEETLTKLYDCLVKKDTPENTFYALFICQNKIVGFKKHQDIIKN